MQSLNAEEPHSASTQLVPEITPKHPLQNSWQLWYYKNVSSDFEKNLFTITTVETVEDFWGLFNHIELASNLNPNCAYYFFKEGIRPMWEDSTNKAGGRWVINCMKKNFKAIDNYWMELLLALIGEAFGEYNDYVCGAFCVIKQKNDRIGVWTKQANDRDSNMHIGRVIKQRLNYQGNVSYEAHDTSRSKTSYQV